MVKMRSCGACRFSKMRETMRGSRRVWVLWCVVREVPVRPEEAYVCQYYAPPRVAKEQRRITEFIARSEDLAL